MAEWIDPVEIIPLEMGEVYLAPGDFPFPAIRIAYSTLSVPRVPATAYSQYTVSQSLSPYTVVIDPTEIPPGSEVIPLNTLNLTVGLPVVYTLVVTLSGQPKPLQYWG